MGNSKSSGSVSRSSSKLKTDDDTGFNSLQLEKLPLSREELKKLKGVFAKHAKGDALDFAGFQLALKDAEVKKQDVSTLERMFKIFDRSGDGLINFREFVVGISTLSKGTLEEQIRFAFEVYDADGSGTISETEMASVFLAVMSLSWGGATYATLDDVRGIAREIIKDCDLDKDGVLREDEFIEAVYRYPVLLEFMGKMGVVIDLRRKERIDREERKRALENPAELTRGRSHTSTDYRETLRKVGLGENDPERMVARDTNDLTSQRSLPILVANGTATLPRTKTAPAPNKAGLDGLFSGLFASKSRDHLHLPAHSGASSSAPSSPLGREEHPSSGTPRADRPAEPGSASPNPSPHPKDPSPRPADPSPRPSPRFAAPIVDPNDTRALDEAHPTRPRGETQPPILNQTFRIV